MHKVARQSLLSLPCNIYLFTLISVHVSGEVTLVLAAYERNRLPGTIDNEKICP